MDQVSSIQGFQMLSPKQMCQKHLEIQKDQNKSLKRTDISQLHIIIEDLSFEDLIRVLNQMYPYKSIKNLKLSLNCYQLLNQQDEFIETLAYLIFQVSQIEHFIINKYAKTIHINNIIPFLKESQNHLELNQLTLELSYLDEQGEKDIHYNLMLLSQEIGYLSQVKKLNFQLQNFKLSDQYAQGIFQCLRDCQNLEKLDIKIIIEYIKISVFEYIKEQILFLKNLSELKLKIHVGEQHLDRMSEMILEIINSCKHLEIFSLNILVKSMQMQNDCESLEQKQFQILSNNIKKLSVKIQNQYDQRDNIIYFNFNNQIFSGCKNLQQISWDLTANNEESFIHFCNILSDSNSLKKIKLKILNNKHFLSLCKQIQQVQQVETLHIQLDCHFIQQVEDISLLSQLFLQNNKIKHLKLNLIKNSLNTQMLNELSLEISKCKQLQSLIFNFSLNILQQLDVALLFNNLQKNEHISYLLIDFNIHKKKPCQKIKIIQKNKFECGFGYIQAFSEFQKIKLKLNRQQQIVQQKIKKLKRLVKCEFICDRFYRSVNYNNYLTYYYFLDIEGQEDEDYF